MGHNLIHIHKANDNIDATTMSLIIRFLSYSMVVKTYFNANYFQTETCLVAIEHELRVKLNKIHEG